MVRNARNKIFLNRFNEKVVVIVINIIKEEYKTKKFIKFIIKFISKKKNIELFNINKRNLFFIITIIRLFKILIQLSIYIINTSII